MKPGRSKSVCHAEAIVRDRAARPGSWMKFIWLSPSSMKAEIPH